jgi:hypothetical protein
MSRGVESIDHGGQRLLARRSRKGLWFCPRDIPPDRIRRALCFAELAGTSTEA